MIPELSFTTPVFIFLFLPITLAAYYALRGTRLRNVVLFVASLVFYASNGLFYLIPLLFTCVLDYIVGARLAAMGDGARRKALFVASVAIQIGLLSVFKYAGWLSLEAQHFATTLGLGLAIAPIVLPLPPGISFYTFHTISYTADIYRHRFRPQGNVVDYITFVGFFPQLVAGPIARASNLLPQIVQLPPLPSRAEIEESMWLIWWGLSKKLLFADRFGDVVGSAERAIASGHASGAGYVFMYAFGFQIYCDFSAYTDIARGIAKLFGIELTRNFRTPYFSASPSEFWHRWHISLSTWLRDYLYIPLGGNQHGALRTLRNLLVTMFLGGLWHGAGFGFIVWGLYHGVLLVLYHTGKLDERIRAALGPRLGAAIAIFVMFQLVSIGWIFFRAQPGALGPIFASLAAAPTAILANPAMAPMAKMLLLLGLPVAVTELVGYLADVEFVDLYRHFPLALKIVFYNVAIGALIYVWVSGSVAPPFIYYKF
ncbi:MAG TPA: MBOAT family O-acyltransferase [Alphaproteobacteria bacterium]|nr:MBOAT family O-acyltransferase [Alphaproteobacteria bacterium]